MKKGSPEGYNAETGLAQPAQKPHTGEPLERQPLYRIRCAQENHCVKMADGRIVEEGRLRATHDALRQWARRRPEPWRGAMEATLFSGWIYDTLKPFAAELQMGHPAMMKAIGASKKKNDKIDAAR
jgi:hypothetical protein